MWLAFIRKHAYHGVGMKANVWGFEHLGPASFLSSQHSKITYNVYRHRRSYGYETGQPKGRAQTSKCSFWQAKNIGDIGEDLPNSEPITEITTVAKPV